MKFNVMKKYFLFSFLLVSALLSAQSGKVAGLVTDADFENEPLAFASVALKGTSLGAQTDMDGNYSITAPVGTYTVIFTYVGMQTVEIENIEVKAGFTTTVNTPMTAKADQLTEIQITVAKTRESEEALIQEKKNSVTIVQSIGAEELSKKGVSDAEGAVTKVSGVSKQSGVKNVFVRGLGDRYNSTTLNGLPLPSDDPEYKNISLDFFGSDLLETVDINKVYTSNITGDNAGANINIDLKGLSGRKAFGFGLSTGVNSQTVGEDFKSIDGEGYFGFSDSNIPVNNLAVYGFENNLAPNTNSFAPNVGFSVMGGRRIDIGDNYLNVYGLLTFDNGYRFLEREVKNTTSNGSLFFDVEGQNYNYDTQQIGMVNLDYRMGKNNIEFISLYIHKNTQSFQEYEGINNPEQDGDRVYINRQQTNDNNLFVNQLLGRFDLSEKLELKVKGSFNAIRGSEPDRRDFQYLFRDGFYSPDVDSGGNNQRYFSELQENDYNATVKLKYNLNKDIDNDLLNYIELGGDYRNTHHVFKATVFNHTFNTRVAVDINNPDSVYNQPSLTAGVFRLETGRGSAINPEAFTPFFYIGDKSTIAGNLNYVKAFNEKFLINVGGRFENINQEVEYNTNIARSSINGPSEINESFFLPSLGVKYTINEENIVRLGASQTYMLPRFKEIAPFRYDGVQFAIQGNPDLEISNIINLDVAYEFYPSKGELISLTGFYKNISDPVSRVEIPSAGNTLTYLNVGEKATVLGIELEAKKDFVTKEMTTLNDVVRESKLSGGITASYINSKQDLDNPLAQFSEDSTELQGAAPYLINADINYNTFIGTSNLNTALVFSYFSDRVYSVGTRGFENITEKGVPTLDFVSSLKLGDNSKISLKARNLLNPKIQLERDGELGNVVLSNYKRGVDISLGYSYQF